MSASPTRSASGGSSATTTTPASTTPSCTPAGPSRRPTLARAECSNTSSDSSSYARRSPKRARNSPSRHGQDTDPVFLDPHDDTQLTPFGPSHTPIPPSRHAHGSVHLADVPTPAPVFPPTLQVSLASPTVVGPSTNTRLPLKTLSRSIGSPLDHKHSYAATSPAPARLPKDLNGRDPRRREMSVPLLSRSLSSFSLSHSTPPVGSELSPDAMTRAPSSSTPPSLTTPVTDTPRRLPQMRRLNTPAPLSRELTYPNSAPMPVIHSILGSPFDVKRPFPYDATSPTCATRNKSDPSALQWQHGPAPPEWPKDDAQLSPTAPRVPRRGSSSDDDDTGSWTSASSLVSTERHAAKQATRPSVISIWDDEATGEVSPTTPLRPLGTPKQSESLLQATRPRGGEGTPWMKRAFESPSSAEPSPIQPLRLSRGGSNSTPAAEPASPSDSFLARLHSSRKADKRPVSCLVSGSDLNGLLGQRRTSEPDSLDSGGTFSTFLARCNGERSTKSEMSTRNGGTPAPSSDANDDFDFSPLRSVAKSTIPPLPPRPPSGLPSSSSASALPRSRPEEQRTMSTPLPKTTPARANTTRMPNSARIRPGLPRRSTGEALQFHTPVSQLFGDDKPSPAAFASTGLVKKRGGKLTLPRFQDMMKARTWSPMNQIDTPSKTESLDEAQTVQLDDWEEQLSPIKPLRSAPFSRNNSHARIPSTASDKIARSGHARIPSTASSIGTSRGLRRKGSAMFSSGNISDSQSEKGSPATPTRNLPFATVQSKFGVSTPSPTTATGNYPFDHRRSFDASPIATPMTKGNKGRVRALSRGPVPRVSNPMLSATYRNQAAGATPSTPVESTISENFIKSLGRVPGAGPFERDYTLLASLGEGEFSHVWKVRHKEDGDLWAVKTGKAFTGPKNRQRQLEEVMILRKLSKACHPHIVKFADSWEQSGRLYIRTELLECGDLARYLSSVSEMGGLGEGRVWKVLAELASALEFIHSHGILHLDMKPSNILLTNEGSLKVADFGMSIFHPDDSGMDGFPQALLDRDLEGDRDYLCPEALLDVPPGTQADVYSLGILILEAALNIALPSNGDAWVKLRNDDFCDIDEHYIERGKDDVVAIAATAPGDPPPAIVSGVLVDTIKRMMVSDPEHRVTLAEVSALGPMTRVRAAMTANDDKPRGRDASGGGWRAGRALVDEESGWIEHVLGE